jgi:hypothetical protein
LFHLFLLKLPLHRYRLTLHLRGYQHQTDFIPRALHGRISTKTDGLTLSFQMVMIWQDKTCVYYNSNGALPGTRTGRRRYDYHGHLSVGDITMTAFRCYCIGLLGSSGFNYKGKSLYINKRNSVPKSPGFQDSMFTFSCALGDMITMVI